MIDQSHTTSQRRLRVFLCHSSGDKLAVRKLYQQLQAEGIDPWLDEKNLLPGQIWKDEIRKAVQATDVVIICLSPGSISKRGFVQKEIKFALDVADEQPEGTIFLIPVKLEECKIPESLHHFHWVNLFEDNGFENLIRALRTRADELGLPLLENPPSQSTFPIEQSPPGNQVLLPPKPPAIPSERIIPLKLAKLQGFIFHSRLILLVGLTLFIIVGSFGLFYFVVRPIQIHQANIDATTIAQAHVTGTSQAINLTATSLFSVATATAVAQDNATVTAFAPTVIAANTTSQNSYPPRLGTLALNDPLRDNTKGYSWDEDANCAFTGGAYHARGSEQVFTPCIAKNTNYNNFTFQVQMTIIKGDYGGIIFRANSANQTYYYFRLGRDGSYTFYFYTSTSTDVQGGTPSGYTPFFHTELNQTNLIAVVAQGNIFDLYVNLHYITSVTASNFSHGQIGVVADGANGPAEVVSSNAKVWTM